MMLILYELKQTQCGLGIFATTNIKKNTIVWNDSFGVKILDKVTNDEERRFAYMEDEKILINLDDSRYINHSCNANLLDVGQTCIAKRDIPKGIEITWDYRGSMNDGQSFICKCGNAKCAGVISQTTKVESSSSKGSGSRLSWVKYRLRINHIL